MWRKYNIWIFVAVVVLLPISVFGIVQLLEHRFKPLPVLGPPGHSIQSFQLRDQNNAAVSLANWEDKIVIADFFFTHCPSICPKMTNNLKRIQAYAEVDNLLINSFSVDPERDSVQQLKSYAEKFDIKGAWHLLTGSKQELYKLARKSFLITATDGDGGADDFIHSENLVLIDKQKRIRGYYDGTDETAVNNLIKDLRKLAKE